MYKYRYKIGDKASIHSFIHSGNFQIEDVHSSSTFIIFSRVHVTVDRVVPEPQDCFVYTRSVVPMYIRVHPPLAWQVLSTFVLPSVLPSVPHTISRRVVHVVQSSRLIDDCNRRIQMCPIKQVGIHILHRKNVQNILALVGLEQQVKNNALPVLLA